MSGFIAKAKDVVVEERKPTVEFFVRVSEYGGDVNIMCKLPGDDEDVLVAWIDPRYGIMWRNTHSREGLEQFGFTLGEDGGIKVV